MAFPKDYIATFELDFLYSSAEHSYYDVYLVFIVCFLYTK